MTSADSTPTIIRTRHDTENPYFQATRASAQDERLSWEARGVLMYLLSKPNDWEIRISDLQQGCGRSKVYSILKSLKDCGYLSHEQPRDEKGRLGSSYYLLYETPCVEKPDTDEPDTANQPLHNIESTEDETPHKKDKAYSETSNDVSGGQAPAPASEPVPNEPVKKATKASQNGKPDSPPPVAALPEPSPVEEKPKEESPLPAPPEEVQEGNPPRADAAGEVDPDSPNIFADIAALMYPASDDNQLTKSITPHRREKILEAMQTMKADYGHLDRGMMTLFMLWWFCIDFRGKKGNFPTQGVYGFFCEFMGWYKDAQNEAMIKAIAARFPDARTQMLTGQARTFAQKVNEWIGNRTKGYDWSQEDTSAYICTGTETCECVHCKPPRKSLAPPPGKGSPFVRTPEQRDHAHNSYWRVRDANPGYFGDKRE